MKNNIPGIFLSLCIAGVAYFLGIWMPIVGGPVFGILLGIIINNTIGKPISTLPGVKYSGKRILQLAIILLGAGLSLNQIAETGISSLLVMVFTLVVAFLTVYGLGSVMKISNKLMALIGIGTAICGGSAIAALSPIIEAEENEISYSISTIFLFNIVAVFVFPLIGNIFHFSDLGFGLWSGTSINDTSSVVAAAYSYSHEAGDYATIVKLTRTLMIVPISLIFAFGVYRLKSKVQENENSDKKRISYNFISIFPWFVLGFLFLAVLRSTEYVSLEYMNFISEVGKIAIIVALTAIGLNANLREMFKTGYKPVLLGFFVWLAVTVTSLGVQFFTNQL